MIARDAETRILHGLKQGLTVILYGARQTGKTTLVKKISQKYSSPLYLDCDQPEVRMALINVGTEALKKTIGHADIVIIDEAQRVENIGLAAKIIHDNKLATNLVLTGSSSLELANKIKEPLTGRTQECHLEPLSIRETSTNAIEAQQQLSRHLLYGGYPGLWELSAQDTIERLRTLATDALFRDAFALDTIYDTTILFRLVQLLALQIGSEVSYNELANKLDISIQTAQRYVDLLEKAFIVYRINQYRKNQRNEIGKLRKIYFYDLGIRNGLINSFSSLELRNDVGALWENFLFNERRKYLARNALQKDMYYWRTTQGKEIDLVEEHNLALDIYEFKYSQPSRNPRLPKEFLNAYGKHNIKVVTQDNFLDFV
jgi:predicted AAA+ superfamily ATPase